MNKDYKYNSLEHGTLGVYFNPKLALAVGDIVRSKKQDKIVIPYLIKGIEGDSFKCINLIDTYEYTIPQDDLYLWIVE